MKLVKPVIVFLIGFLLGVAVIIRSLMPNLFIALKEGGVSYFSSDVASIFSSGEVIEACHTPVNFNKYSVSAYDLRRRHYRTPINLGIDEESIKLSAKCIGLIYGSSGLDYWSRRNDKYAKYIITLNEFNSTEDKCVRYGYFFESFNHLASNDAKGIDFTGTLNTDQFTNRRIYNGVPDAYIDIANMLRDCKKDDLTASSYEELYIKYNKSLNF